MRHQWGMSEIPPGHQPSDTTPQGGYNSWHKLCKDISRKVPKEENRLPADDNTTACTMSSYRYKCQICTKKLILGMSIVLINVSETCSAKDPTHQRSCRKSLEECSNELNRSTLLTPKLYPISVGFWLHQT